jgi:hypothetical protein
VVVINLTNLPFPNPCTPTLPGYGVTCFFFLQMMPNNLFKKLPKYGKLYFSYRLSTQIPGCSISVGQNSFNLTLIDQMRLKKFESIFSREKKVFFSRTSN